ncbi:MAG TPA: DNA mismatch repair endonuclease MutL [Lachnospiraceae bacterium]|nr:DNA mismatch repair endonuclease MutL [Lachnospiraceae bacterium]
MGQIQVLDQITIDKIAAGEVIERPASVVKELVENAIDAGATAIVTEIQEGGISLIRISDNGCGIEREDIPNAFLRHSTSKIRSVDDLVHIGSLGFRGEALSSIAAVAQVELRTKTKKDTFGSSYRIEGGKEISFSECGVPDGTTFLVHQLFYNTPARRKFLKTPMTEASHVSDLLVRLALSHPEISFRFDNNGQTRMHTSGNGRLKDVIYHIYGRDVANHLLKVDTQKNGMKVTGYLGEPIITRGNRNFENYFINGRYIKNSVISKAIEDAYKDFSMQHKYPFVVLHFTMPGETIDVNVHPTKMELRFSNQQEVYQFVYEMVSRVLHGEELIPEATLPEVRMPEAIPSERTEPAKTSETRDLDYFMQKMRERVTSYHNQMSEAEVKSRTEIAKPEAKADRIREAVLYRKQQEQKAVKKPEPDQPVAVEQEQKPELPRQLNFFDEKFLKRESRAEYKIVGQVFDTYWIIELQDKMYIIDQHAAHERVLYEKTLKGMRTREYTSQYISPPLVLSLSMQEAQLLETYLDHFTRIGFEIEPFGTDTYAVRAIPDNLFGITKKELLMEMLDSLSDEIGPNLAPELIDEKIASMSCKAAVKGNSRLSRQEVDTLISELLTLENPYHCPHGRPTIIEMSKRELEKKFKRIV